MKIIIGLFIATFVLLILVWIGCIIAAIDMRRNPRKYAEREAKWLQKMGCDAHSVTYTRHGSPVTYYYIDKR